VRSSSGWAVYQTELLVRNSKRDQDKVCLFPHRPSERRLACACDSVPWPWAAQESGTTPGCRISAPARSCCAPAGPGVSLGRNSVGAIAPSCSRTARSTGVTGSLKKHGQKFTLRLLLVLARRGRITLLCHCAEDQLQCHRYLLKQALERLAAK